MTRDEAEQAARLLTKHDRTRLFRELYASQPCTRPFVATVDTEIVGLAVGNVHHPVGWIGHVVVDPGYQGMGTASALLDRCIDSLTAAGCTAIVSTVESPKVHRALGSRGFVEQSAYHILRRSMPLQRSSLPRRLTPSDRQCVLDMDRQATGEDRSHLMSMWLTDGWAIPDIRGRPRAFWIPFPFGAPGAGPLIAEDPLDALALLSCQQGGRATSATISDENEAGRRVLLQNGFTEVAKVPRLARGALTQSCPGRIYGIFSLALG